MDRPLPRIPIVDAHQHFWNPRVNYHPWLCDEPPIPFRYGDYASLRRPYLPQEYLQDAGLYAAARRLNERPRMTLNYETPAERFSQLVASTG